MKLIETYSLYLENEIKSLHFPVSPSHLYDPIRYFMTLGGKRMRPMLTLLSAELFGIQKEIALPSALAVEIFHNFTLIHDDIMDEAPLRRNQETVHKKWNNNVAILSGDVLLVHAYQQLAKQDPSILPELLSLFNKTAVEVCEGQQMDMDFEEKETVSLQEYIEMIRLKTSVLLGCALEMGAIVANTSPENKKLAYEFGQQIGIAFQIQDDYLDLYGDAEKFGKQTGGDVLCDKKTFLQIKAKELGSPEQLKQMDQLRTETDPQQKIEQTKNLFEALNIPQITLEAINSYYKKGLESLALIEVNEEKKMALKGIATHLLSREN